MPQELKTNFFVALNQPVVIDLKTSLPAKGFLESAKLQKME